ncbi:DUF3791 domain-containing protein [Peptococcus simiae]|uniref:DUF3791 domain-containing protein n=1 Tax=Peptococcus simiae TaxID=1643805 RepID=A0ABW9GZZ2_9FIRM
MTRAEEYLIFFLERYRYHKGLSGKDAIELFQSKGISEYILSHYDALHVQSEQSVIEEIDELLEENILSNTP